MASLTQHRLGLQPKPAVISSLGKRRKNRPVQLCREVLIIKTLKASQIFGAELIFNRVFRFNWLLKLFSVPDNALVRDDSFCISRAACYNHAEKKVLERLLAARKALKCWRFFADFAAMFRVASIKATSCYDNSHFPLPLWKSLLHDHCYAYDSLWLFFVLITLWYMTVYKYFMTLSVM